MHELVELLTALTREFSNEDCDDIIEFIKLYNTDLNLFHKYLDLKYVVRKLINTKCDFDAICPDSGEYGLLSNIFLPLHYNFEFENSVQEKWKEIVSELCKIKFHPQRSPGWFEARQGCITASDACKCIGESKYGNNTEDIILEKCGYKREFNGNIFTYHGQKYEDVALLFYEHLYGVKVIEFGLLQHPEISFVSASPDGITENGIMLEIKCPYKRKIINYDPNIHDTSNGDKVIIPHDYYIQMQLQLEVTKLDICDFVECSITEYSNKLDYLEDTCKTCEFKSKNNQVKGRIIKRVESGEISYIYPPQVKMLAQEYSEWETQNIIKGDKVVYWKIEHFGIYRVHRDYKYFSEALLPKLSDFWDNIKSYKENPQKLEELVSKKVNAKKKSEEKNKPKCYELNFL